MFTSKVFLTNVDDYSDVERIGKFLSEEFTNRYKELLPYNSRLSVYPINIYDENLSSKSFIHVDLVFKDAYGRSIANNNVCKIPFSYFKNNVIIEKSPILVFKDTYGRSIANNNVCKNPFSYFKNNVIIEESPIEFKTVLKCSDELDSFIKGHLSK